MTTPDQQPSAQPVDYWQALNDIDLISRVITAECSERPFDYDVAALAEVRATGSRRYAGTTALFASGSEAY